MEPSPPLPPKGPQPTQGRRSRSFLGSRISARSNKTPRHEQGFVGHLIELRDRLLRIVLMVVLAFLAIVPFANQVYTVFATPIMASLPAGTSMIATGVVAPFLAPFKLSLVLSVFVSMPFILYHVWAFIAPGLYGHERRMMLPLMVASTALFYLGVAFAFYVVFPLVFGFLVSVAPEGVTVAPDITSYLDVALKLFFAFGLAFEVPIATIVVVWAGIATPQQLVAKRPYIIVGAFVLGMLLTPPDIISQTLLAVPMWLLFEIGLLLSRTVARQKAERQAAAEAEESGE